MTACCTLAVDRPPASSSVVSGVPVRRVLHPSAMSDPQGTAKSTTMNGKANGKSATSNKMLKVLLVEDDLPTQAVVAALLRSCQYEGKGATQADVYVR